MVNVLAIIPEDSNALGYPIVPLQYDLATAMDGPCADLDLFGREITVNVAEQYVPTVRRALKDRGLILKASEQ